MNTHRRRSRISLSLALLTLAALPMLGSPSPANANLLANPGFEDAGGSFTGWTTFGAGLPPTNVQISTPTGDNIIRTGVAAAKVYGGFNNCPGTGSFNVSGFYQAFTSPTPGNVYQLSGYSYISAADSIPGTDTCNKNRMLAGRGNGPSPYEIGSEWVQRYFQVMQGCARAAQLRLEEKLAETPRS